MVPRYPKVRNSPEAVLIWSCGTSRQNAVWLPTVAAAAEVTPKTRETGTMAIAGLREVSRMMPTEPSSMVTAEAISGPRTRLRLASGREGSAETAPIGSSRSPAATADIPCAASIQGECLGTATRTKTAGAAHASCGSRIRKMTSALIDTAKPRVPGRSIR
ncbi:hypothetical protein [Streptomyces roseochromogenus]|uniref:Uncharacterized protein n=1 Tax=Streptomyces roseochromogenus subsp. oscitans DS 12.976 TaxID=1352936 RepID=V6JLI4_STRRC|nr:hypothetical protein [Streptomyces roseochromogenus]EST20740.1 hypothetical protein M878_38945 [Streptomyces roseochromogenus subsp. oscitans DS 12.976]